MKAFLFPGQGSQKVGMGKELVDKYPVAKRVFEEADEALGFSISRICFEGPEDDLRLTANSQPAILTSSIAVLRVIEQETSLRPLIAAGHSLGEYSALVCAGALSLTDAVRVVHQRGKFMQDAVPVGVGAMAAVGAIDPAEVPAICRDAAQGQVVVPANYNSPRQIVVAGHREAVDRLVQLVSDRGGIAKVLNVSAPFHSPLMEPAAKQLEGVLAKVTINELTIPVVANVDAEPNRDRARVADLLVRQVTGSVRWTDSVRKLMELGVKEAIEIGVGRTLTGLARQIDRSLTLTNIEGVSDIETIKAAHPATKQAEAATTTEYADGRKIMPDGRIVWPDGMVWDPPSKVGPNGY